MKKIPSLFQRNHDGDRLVRNEVTPGAEWVIAGEGVATRKWDGTACLVKGAKLFKRFDARKAKVPPLNFIPAQEQNPVTGHWPGWLPVGDGPEDNWHREGWLRYISTLGFGEDIADGTYELVGPKVQGGLEGTVSHYLVRHGIDTMPDCPRTFDELKLWLAGQDIEGVVWHHLDGRMVKIKKKDFGLPR